MKRKVNDIASIRTGLVLNRYKYNAKSEKMFIYKQVGLSCFHSSIFLDGSKADEFESGRTIDGKYLTKEGDILVRLRAPVEAVFVSKESEGLIIPSLLAVIRVDDSQINPAYLAYYLNTRYIARRLNRELKGTSIPMIKTNDIESLELLAPSLIKQKKLIDFLYAVQKEKNLLQKLIDEKEQLSQTILDTIIQQSKEMN